MGIHDRGAAYRIKDSVVKDVQNEMLSSFPISDKEYEDVLSGFLLSGTDKNIFTN